MKAPENIDNAIAAYLTGEATAGERVLLEVWISASDENRRYFETRREIWFSSMTSVERVRYDAARAFSKFYRLLQFKSAQQEVSHRPGGKSMMRPVRKAGTVRRIAAAVSVVAAIALIIILVKPSVSVCEDKTAEVVVEAPAGSRTSLVLPDGTEVRLNSGSVLTYLSDFGKKNRAVRLTGEAYFDVRHSETMPFRVIAGDVVVNDLGTIFNVRSYGDDQRTEVALIEGRVSFCTAEDSTDVEMEPGDMAVYDAATGLSSISKTDVESIVSWIYGCYVFEDEPLRSIVRRLERGFDVVIRIEAPEAADISFCGNFDGSVRSVDEILSTLSATGKIRYRSSGNTYTIY